MALRAAEAGMSVIGLDSNPVVVDRLNGGSSHIDDVSDDELAAGLRSGFTASIDPAVIADADVVVVCVPTPLAEEGGPDLAPVRAAAAAIGRARPAGHALHPGVDDLPRDDRGGLRAARVRRAPRARA